VFRVSFFWEGGVCHFLDSRKAFAAQKRRVPIRTHVHTKHTQTNKQTNASSEGCSFLFSVVFTRRGEKEMMTFTPTLARAMLMCFFITVVTVGGVWRPVLLGAEAATIDINWNGMQYTIDDDSTVQESRDFAGVTKTIGPYYLSERAQHIKDEFTEPYDWADYLQDFQSFMDEF
jgi:hypothetical protein